MMLNTCGAIASCNWTGVDVCGGDLIFDRQRTQADPAYMQVR